MTNWAPFRQFVQALTRVVELDNRAAAALLEGRHLLAELLKQEDWLHTIYKQPDDRFYRQYLLWCDPFERFSVASFVWGPGQATPIHDHTVWGLIGVLEGAEFVRTYRHAGPDGIFLEPLGEAVFHAGDVSTVSPDDIDVHEVRNHLPDRASISIHVYGGNIGQIDRHVFDPSTRAVKAFRSGYANTTLPNIFNHS